MLTLLFEDNYLIAVNKPAGICAEGSTGMESEVSKYLRETYPWKKQLITGVVHRLDRKVSGVMLFAKTPMALKALNRQFEERPVRKTYVAILEKKTPEAHGELRHWLVKDSENRKAVIATHKNRGAKECVLHYKIITEFENLYLVKIEPLTGRYHQIRAQMSAIGCPILGDDKYGAQSITGQQAIYLHSNELVALHPKTGEILHLKAPLPDSGQWANFSHVKLA
ncbi:MAG: RluA family pseudouridine synthase [Saprospiraceae bacterium]|nr:MAG: RluA family pseudouridine synthase [Saprospiraceae bacterium]